MKRLIALAIAALAGCGGGGAQAPAAPHYDVKMMARLAQIGPVPASPGFNASIITPGAAVTPEDSVAQQASFPGDVALAPVAVPETVLALLSGSSTSALAATRFRRMTARL